MMRAQEQELNGYRAKIDLIEEDIEELQRRTQLNKNASERQSRLGSAISRAKSARSQMSQTNSRASGANTDSSSDHEPKV